MSVISHHDGDELSPELEEILDDLCDRFEKAWKAATSADSRPRLEEYVAAAPP
jgi:hypothetical protein